MLAPVSRSQEKNNNNEITAHPAKDRRKKIIKRNKKQVCINKYKKANIWFFEKTDNIAKTQARLKKKRRLGTNNSQGR